MHYAIEAIHLTKEFSCAENVFDLSFPWRKKKTALVVNDINLQITKGESFGLLGPNGSGKTTLLKLLTTLILPTKGTACINGYNIIKDEKKVRSFISLVLSEERSFYWRLNGRQNLEFFAAMHKFTPEEARKKIGELAVLCEIEEYMDNAFYEYSAGVRQRFSIARSLINNSQVMFMDEPTKNLDTNIAQKLRRFIKEKLVHSQGRTLLFATNNYDEAAIFSDRVALLEKGQVKTITEL